MLALASTLAPRLRALLAGAAAVLLIPIAVAADTADGPWPAFVHQYLEDYFVAHPDFATGAGRHEFDGQLPDWSAAGIAREIARLEAKRVQALAIAPANAREGFERAYLLSRVDADLFWLRDARWPISNPAFYAGALDPTVYLTRPYAPLPARVRLHQLPQGGTGRRCPDPARPAGPLAQDLTSPSASRRPRRLCHVLPQRGFSAIFATVQDAALQGGLKAALGPGRQ